jgi:hypothetical protein
VEMPDRAGGGVIDDFLKFGYGYIQLFFFN